MQNENKHNLKRKFPTTMFATAGLASCCMVFLISAVFSQANTPCIHHFSSSDSVIVNTSSSQIAQFDNNEELGVCNRDNQQITWLTWMFKESDSVEFHYLDLLELLSRK